MYTLKGFLFLEVLEMMTGWRRWSGFGAHLIYHCLNRLKMKVDVGHTHVWVIGLVYCQNSCWLQWNVIMRLSTAKKLWLKFDWIYDQLKYYTHISTEAIINIIWCPSGSRNCSRLWWPDRQTGRWQAGRWYSNVWRSYWDEGQCRLA